MKFALNIAIASLFPIFMIFILLHESEKNKPETFRATEIIIEGDTLTEYYVKGKTYLLRKQ